MPFAAAKPAEKKKTIVPVSSDERRAALRRLYNLGNSLEQYAKAHHFNTRYSFMVDMKLPSGQNRFFVYDMKKDSVLLEGLVTHGSGRNYSEKIEFSNEANSYCTSLGRYKIGTAYNGRFGLAYKLHGLEATNSNAYARAVVLHAHSCVPAYEVPGEICQSLGCPTVSPSFLNRLKNYLDHSEKPMLLWVVN